MSDFLTPDDKFNLITRNLQEFTDEKRIREILEVRNMSVYWGTAPTGRPHVAYFIPLLKIRDFLEAGCTVKILFADIHAMLDNMKSSPENIKKRVVYYQILIKAILQSLGVNIEKIEFVLGSDFQLSRDYALDVFKILSKTTERNAKKAGAEVVKQVDNPLISSLVYPSMQALDEIYLKVDCQFGGVDQRKIFMYARKHLPKVCYTTQIHLMNKMMRSTTNEKMSSSDKEGKIDFLDTEKQLRKKINSIFCEEKNIQTNILILFSEIIFPILKLKGVESVKITEKNYSDYETLEGAFEKGEIHPADLKEGCFELLNQIIKPIRTELHMKADMYEGAYEE